MRRLAVIVAALVVAVPGTAFGAGTRTIKTTGTIQGHDVAQQGADGGFTFAGVVRDSRSGRGAIITDGTVQGLTSTGTFVSFAKRGTIRGTFELTATLNADQTVSLTGKTRIRGGTGAFKGAKGSGTLTGQIDAQGYTRFEYANTYKLPQP